ncbi:DUF3303 domain-containing protein [Saccharopolyspora pogona]|uniref:DUF3303 domain-containing protein n=1 Tax=Saccharopolyspora pogona TaxID=333966 RepID=UPI001685C4E8|nr:DUF3303 family protein [Saccharopolyspora pogona]
MLWYCRFTWHQHTRAEDVRRRVLQQHEAGTNLANQIKGWYNLAGGGAGFLMLESDSPQQVSEILQPYMDLMSWDVHAVYELSYQKAIEEFRKKLQATA